MLLFCVPIIIFEAMFEAMFEANENKRRLEPRLKQRPHERRLIPLPRPPRTIAAQWLNMGESERSILLWSGPHRRGFTRRSTRAMLTVRFLAPSNCWPVMAGAWMAQNDGS